VTNLSKIIQEASKGWYQIKRDGTGSFFRIYNYTNKIGNITYKDQYFIAEQYNEKGEMKNKEFLLASDFITLLDSIPESNLPWKRTNNKPNLSAHPSEEYRDDVNLMFVGIGD